MRNLVVLRGCPGAGKSTWIKENGLEPYTLCPDTIRTMVCAPVYTEQNDTEMTISQQNESYVWSLLFELLEKRMKNGDFVVIDATHSKSSDFSRYNDLCSTYRYRKYVVSFADVPAEVCKERNLMRDAYKRVPPEVIDKMYARFTTQEKTSGWVDVPRDKFWDTFSNKVFDFNKYERIHIFGDIHGCYEPMMEYILKSSVLVYEDRHYEPTELVKYLNGEDFYIFTGDYLDRGLQNKEVMEFMTSICKMPNVLLLEGNHERWFWYYANEQDAEIKSREFFNNTVPQIKSIEPSKMRELYRKLGQMALFSYRGQTYFVNHGGLAKLSECLALVSTNCLINGVGKFKYPIDERYTENMKDNPIIQVHGHRNIETEGHIKDIPLSFSLEDKVEFGGNLKVLEINERGNFFHSIKNDIFREITEEEQDQEEYAKVARSDMNMDNVVDRMRLNRNIKESVLEGGISSFNFTRQAFEKDRWNAETVKARGLFIDTENNKIVARGYEKFFNINEQEQCKLFNLKFLFDTEQPVIAYKKYNGFLGILSYYHDGLQFHSKSSNAGEYAIYFKDLFYKQFDKNQVLWITEYLKNNNMSMTFEVIDLENDPHIIDEKRSRIVLLDIIRNELDFSKLPYEEVKMRAELWKLKDDEYKQIYTTFDSYRQLTEFFEEHKNENNLVDTDIEGVVIECGTFMTKLKFSYYSFWKGMRAVSEQVQGAKSVKLNKLFNATANYFYKFVLDKFERKMEKFTEIKQGLNRDDITAADLRRASLDFGNNKIVVRKRDKRRFYVDRDIQLEPIPDIEIEASQELLQELKDLQKNWDIISLRNEYYENGGI